MVINIITLMMTMMIIVIIQYVSRPLLHFIAFYLWGRPWIMLLCYYLKSTNIETNVQKKILREKKI